MSKDKKLDTGKQVDSHHQEGNGQKWDEGKQSWFSMPLIILKPLSDVFEAGIAKGYGRFNCLLPFTDSNRRFYDGQMRHTEACQLDPLAIDEETGCYHSAQIAFNSLLRLHNALQERAKNIAENNQ